VTFSCSSFLVSMAWMLIGTFWMFSERFSAVTTISARAVLPAAGASAARAGRAARQVVVSRTAKPIGAATARVENIEFIIIHPWALGLDKAEPRAGRGRRQANASGRGRSRLSLWPICPMKAQPRTNDQQRTQ